MTAEIVEIDTKTVSRDCVEALEEALQLAKDGVITSVGIAAVNSNSTLYTDFCGFEAARILAPISILNHRLNAFLEE